MDLMIALQHEDLAEQQRVLSRVGWRLKPQSADQIAALLHRLQTAAYPVALSAHEAQWLEKPVWLDVRGMNRIRKHPQEDFMISVETGLTWGELARHLAGFGQAFPLSYPAEEPILYALAEDRPAPETGHAGYPRDWVLKTELATPDGHLTISGADVVKNATGYDLHKVYVGSRHALGVITAATLKLIALPAASRTWQYRIDSAQAALDVAAAFQNSPLPLHRCEVWGHADGWTVLVQVAGNSEAMVECEAVRQRVASQAPATSDPMPPVALTDAWVLEVALPLGQVGAFMQQAPACERCWIRPAAGLIHLGWPERPNQPEAWQRLAHALGGFAHWHAMAEPDATLIEWNLPPDPILRTLLKRLKTSYDPEGILATPFVPLSPSPPDEATRLQPAVPGAG